MLAGFGAALGVLFAGLLGASRAGVAVAAVLAASAGLLAGLGIGGWPEAAAGAAGGLLGAAGAGQVVRGALRRGATWAGAAVWMGLVALLVAALALVPAVGYLEAFAVPLLGARLRQRTPERFAGLRTLAR